MSASPTQLLIVALIVLLLFGAKRIPELGKGLGTGLRSFREGLAGGDSEPPSKRGADTDPETVEPS